ncbi:RIP metalloprotease RseP [Gaoshiqia sp. Z1-71]|uniref:RIP metalloprotease RseP n=1 Tax=Gaoshiqia hydrogeniformans TaxID=3290090 RepID=UPI003BF8DFFB
MEQILIKAAQLILSLSILVILHEFGHYAFARLFKTRVEKFYLFFDPWFSLLKTKRGETEYGIGWLPLGGYVKISGMIDESMDKEAMKLPPQPWEFRSKKAYQRLLIMVGGVLMNFIFAFVIYIGVLYAWGTQYLPTENVKHGIMVSETGEQIGLQNGDMILSVDHQYIENFYKIIPTLVLDDAKTIQVLRDGKQVNIDITTEALALLIKSKSVIDPRIPFECKVGKILNNSPADQAGLEKGDIFVDVDGHQFTFYDEFTGYVRSQKEKEVTLNILRDGQAITIPVTVGDDGTIGFYPAFLESATEFLQYKTIRYSFAESIPAGIKRGVSTIKDYLKQFKLIFSPKTKAYESLGGFIAIGNIFPGVWDWHDFWNMTAFLSIILAVMNLLPIPALDGGHVTFLLFEMVTGRKPGEKFLEYAQITGMIILLALVLFANANDIIKLFN